MAGPRMVLGSFGLLYNSAECVAVWSGFVMSRYGRSGSVGVLALAAFACAALPVASAIADTLESALVQAYQNNPTLNAQRASVRATDEGVPQALSGYRPRVTVTASGGEQSLSTTSKLTTTTPSTYVTQSGYNSPFSAGATISQTIFNGFQTANRTRQAESQVLAARSTLRQTEQKIGRAHV